MGRDQEDARVARLRVQNRILGTMSVLSHLALVDDRSAASNPGKVSVQWLRYVTHFTFWPVCFAGGFLASAALAVARPLFWAVPALVLALNLQYWVRVRMRFQFGCVNPSKVVSTAPFMLAVFTDLTTGDGPYPVVKTCFIQSLEEPVTQLGTNAQP